MEKSWKAVERLLTFVGAMLVSGAVVSIAALLHSPCLVAVGVVSFVVFLVLWLLTLKQWIILHRQDIRRLNEHIQED